MKGSPARATREEDGFVEYEETRGVDDRGSCDRDRLLAGDREPLGQAVPNGHRLHQPADADSDAGSPDRRLVQRILLRHGVSEADRRHRRRRG